MEKTHVLKLPLQQQQQQQFSGIGSSMVFANSPDELLPRVFARKMTLVAFRPLFDSNNVVHRKTFFPPFPKFGPKKRTNSYLTLFNVLHFLLTSLIFVLFLTFSILFREAFTLFIYLSKKLTRNQSLII